MKNKLLYVLSALLIGLYGCSVLEEMFEPMQVSVRGSVDPELTPLSQKTNNYIYIKTITDEFGGKCFQARSTYPVNSDIRITFYVMAYTAEHGWTNESVNLRIREGDTESHYGILLFTVDDLSGPYDMQATPNEDNTYNYIVRADYSNF